MSAKRDTGFFRQSGWMVISTFVGGTLMTLVHTVARKMGAEDYSTFGALLRVLIILGIPAAALQTIFARQAAAVKNDAEEAELASTVRSVLFATFSIWALCAIAIFASARPISHLLKIHNVAALGFMLVIGLTSLWIPVAKGVLQGQHHFFGLGWLQICDGAGRFTATCLVVLAFGGKAASVMFAAVVGQVITIVLGALMTRPVWAARSEVKFRWRKWLNVALPMTVGLGTVLLMQSIDMLFVQSLFTDTRQTALYLGAMLTGFAIVQFIAPVALVMFARVAKSVSRSEDGGGLRVTLVATILFGMVSGIGCTIFPKLPLMGIYFSNREMWSAAPLVPWFAWALLPLTVANVLVQNLLARGDFRAICWLMLVPPLYTAALCLEAPALVRMAQPFDAFVRVIQTVGAANLALCLVAALFSLGNGPLTPLDPALAGPEKASDKTNSQSGQKADATA